jgi:V/A-type H+-transporting ATPase subunit D
MNNLPSTKGNLNKLENKLAFSKKGYDLLDQKRNVLMVSFMDMIQIYEEKTEALESLFEKGYEALKYSAIVTGTESIQSLTEALAKEDDIQVLLKTSMGVETPHIRFERNKLQPSYGLFRSSATFDEALLNFDEIKYRLYELANIHAGCYALALEIKRTQKRANSLDKIQIPKYKAQIKGIENALEEKAREDSIRLKKIKDRSKK